jgi:hypothetical protein
MGMVGFVFWKPALTTVWRKLEEKKQVQKESRQKLTSVL